MNRYCIVGVDLQEDNEPTFVTDYGALGTGSHSDPSRALTGDLEWAKGAHDLVAVADRYWFPAVNPIVGIIEDGKLTTLCTTGKTEKGIEWVKSIAEQHGLAVELTSSPT